MLEVIIRKAETPADYAALQRAQRLSWGISDDSYVVPIATMIGAQHHGGLVLGAFLPNGEAAGLSFAFLGRTEGRLCLYSQLTGIVPEYQSLGLGRKMKYTQRDYCREQGIPCIVWAFDPFQPGNARFNLSILGATSNRYLDDMYGPRFDALNAGVPTDRLIAEWEVDAEPREILGEPRVLLDLPNPVNRTAVASAFRDAFAQGYRAVGFLKPDTSDRTLGSYLLVKD